MTKYRARGGVAVLHNFPADGEYVFRMMLHGEPTGRLFGTTDADGEQLEVSIDGERVVGKGCNPGNPGETSAIAFCERNPGRWKRLS